MSRETARRVIEIESQALADLAARLDDSFDGDNGSHIFVGMIALDPAGNPVPVIDRVRLVNGNEGPERDTDEGVTLDDFVFDQPDTP